MKQNSYFVTGTDTDIGKTVTSTTLAVGLRTSYWKPIQTGASQQTDRSFVERWIGDRALPESYAFGLPASPHIAAECAGEKIKFNKIYQDFLTLSGEVIVEGAGGLLVPIDDFRTMRDLISVFSLPSIVVTSTELGSINHTLLTLECLKARDIEVAGFITVGSESDTIVRTLERFSGSLCLGHIPHCESFSKEWFEKAFRGLNIADRTKEVRNAL